MVLGLCVKGSVFHGFWCHVEIQRFFQGSDEGRSKRCLLEERAHGGQCLRRELVAIDFDGGLFRRREFCCSLLFFQFRELSTSEQVEFLQLVELRIVSGIQLRLRSLFLSCFRRALIILGRETLSIIVYDCTGQIGQMYESMVQNVLNLIAASHQSLLVLAEELLLVHDSHRVLKLDGGWIQEILHGLQLGDHRLLPGNQGRGSVFGVSSIRAL